MNFSERMRIGTVALVAAAALSHPGIAHAASVPGTPSPTATVEYRQTETGREVAIQPGQTIALEPEGQAVAKFVIEEGEESTLPPGWSVLTASTGLKITAAATAAEGEFAAVKVVGINGETGDLRVVVERADSAPAPAAKPSPSSSSSWINELVGRVVTFFGS
ncbi:hypothetical protein G7Y29_00680 [Corynebacterium qintianiae]|uniref:Uncharacterized protein n=1 Tax=Corynebacterium qintianiae TaxID=2709392 RepID=A0A7T0KN42_9CORY|nr:hypothetical protein [Corynebacterium qintianiae]QPK83379.1 hypothetical protein G7Y29_00680 [Corynebacterium qintianiae]